MRRIARWTAAGTAGLLLMWIAMAVQPLGIVASGYLVEGIGLHSTVLLIAVLIQGLGAVMLFIPAFRSMYPPALEDAMVPFEPVAAD